MSFEDSDIVVDKQVRAGYTDSVKEYDCAKEAQLGGEFAICATATAGGQSSSNAVAGSILTCVRIAHVHANIRVAVK